MSNDQSTLRNAKFVKDINHYSLINSQFSSGCPFILFEDQPVRALVLVHVEAFAIVASDAFARDDFRPTNRSPLTGFFADLARVAFGPAFDPKDRQI